MFFGKNKLTPELVSGNHGTEKYNGRRFANPYFDNTPKKDYQKILKYWLILAIILLIWGSLATAPFFRIKNVNIVSEGRIGRDKIAELVENQKHKRAVFNLLPQENIFLFKSGDLTSALKYNFNFRDVNVQKKFPNKVSVAIQQRDPEYIISNDDVNYLIDKEGFIITKDVNSGDEALHAKIISHGIDTTGLSRFDTRGLHLEQIFSLLDRVKSDLSLIIDKVELGADGDTIEFKVKNGPKIYFSAGQKIDQQIKKLLVVKNELKDAFMKKEYFDLRINENIYIK